jgi:hypothetical protein
VSRQGFNDVTGSSARILKSQTPFSFSLATFFLHQDGPKKTCDGLRQFPGVLRSRHFKCQGSCQAMSVNSEFFEKVGSAPQGMSGKYGVTEA